MATELELNPNNPYAKGYIVEYDDGTQSLERDTDEVIEASPGDIIITVVLGMSLSDLAGQHYKDSQLWHKIAQANPQLDDYWNLPVGMDIRIPDPANLTSLNNG